MLRAALLLTLAPLLLGACNSLPEAAARQTKISAQTPWPRLLDTAELDRALPAPDQMPRDGESLRNATEAELTARSAGLKARAEALRRRSAE
ncbi:hypothetical protein ACFOHK_09655 [Falsigemmobacter intermedius]|uniref:DUF3035 domain-containing protein n=1 Tax=Falsigemmobacter intermedius TaxID=1553448 RepID=A0A3S3YDZ4_9RHOB|nr:hypothetical protein [Falsigemmobacter intermedius]RWY41796.1 hypothetical protein EP867_08675 [Falsigemmobacter intermedius]